MDDRMQLAAFLTIAAMAAIHREKTNDDLIKNEVIEIFKNTLRNLDSHWEEIETLAKGQPNKSKYGYLVEKY